MKSFDSLIGPATRAAMRDDRRIRDVISRIVPAETVGHVAFCRLAGRQLRVTVDGAAWVAKLRFSERTLLAALSREGLDVRTVSWHVAPAKRPSGRETARRSALTASPHAARAVLSAVEGLGEAGATTSGSTAAGEPTADEDELARQMRRMARNLAGRPPDDDPSDP